jgi:hypothetical protein
MTIKNKIENFAKKHPGLTEAFQFAAVVGGVALEMPVLIGKEAITFVKKHPGLSAAFAVAAVAAAPALISTAPVGIVTLAGIAATTLLGVKCVDTYVGDFIHSPASKTWPAFKK